MTVGAIRPPVMATDRLTGVLRATDTEARLGAEDFAILLEEMGRSADAQYAIQGSVGLP